MVLVQIGGRKVIQGGNAIANGPWDPSKAADVAAKAAQLGFGHVPEPAAV